MSSVSKHSAILIGAYFITAILNYGFSFGLSWFFTPGQFGVLGVAQSLLLLVALAVSSGFAWTAANDVAAGGITGHTRRRFRTALLANTLLGIVLAAGLWLGYENSLLNLGQDYRWIVPLIGITVVLLAARSVFSGAARGDYLFGPVAINLVLEVVIKVLFGFAFVWAGLGAPGVVLAFAVGAGVSLIHSLWITRSSDLFRGSWAFVPQVLTATGPLFVGMLGPALMLNLDILGLKLFSSADGDALAGLYQAAAILARSPVFIAQALTVVLFSYASSNLPDLQTEKQDRGAYIQTAVKAWWRLLLPVGVAMVLVPRAFLNLLFPAAYQGAALALQVAGAGGALLALSTLLIGVFQAEGKRRQPAFAASSAVFLQILTLAIAVPRFGILGAALSLLVAGGFSLAGLIPLFPRWPLRSFRWQTAARRSLPLVVLSAGLILLPHETRLLAILKFAAAGSSYLLALSWAYPTQREGEKDQTAEPPVIRIFNHFVQVLLGGRS